MRIGVLINARMNSTRLHGKHGKFIGDAPAIVQLIRRLKEFEPIIATGNEDENYSLQFMGAECVFGSDWNIPLRHLTIATTRERGFDAIVSVDGDDILTSPQAVRDCITALSEGKELVRTEGLLYGMNVLWGYSVPFLKACLEGKYDETLDTGWGEIFPQDKIHYIRYDVGNVKGMQATLDYLADLEWFRDLFRKCPSDIMADDRKLTDWIRENEF